MIRVSTVVLVAAVVVYLVARAVRTESPSTEPVEPPTGDPLVAEVVLDGAAVSSTAEDAATEAVQPSRVAEESPASEPEVVGTNVLRVVLEGITEESARLATVTVTGVEEGHRWSAAKVRESRPCEGLTSEFDLDPFLARVAKQLGTLSQDEMEVEVDHPRHFSETIRIPMSGGAERESGQTVYEARVKLAEVVFWPALTLDVRDAQTRAHLEDVELRCVPTAFMGLWQQPGTGEPFTLISGGLDSPIVLLGGREEGEPEDWVAGLALGPAAGEAPQPAELFQPEEIERGVMVYARSPGYAWGQIVIDVSTGAKRELLLGPAAALDVRFANVQHERYAALEKDATLCVTRVGSDGGEGRVWYQPLDETLETEGLRLEALEPGEFAVSVELGGAMSWRKQPVLAREEFTLAAGETRELVLTLADSPSPPVLATLGGMLSFPAFGGEDEVRLQLYQADYKHGDADDELSLADMERVGGALPTWSFRLEDLPVGRYQVRLVPLLKNWMIELPAGGREDVELVVPELAEVLVETVDARTGERIPLELIRYADREDLPGRVRHEASTGDRTTADFEGTPGRFRFWSAPGPASIGTWRVPSGLDIGRRTQDLELVPGVQSVRFELAPACSLRFEFRVDGAALPRDDGIFTGLSEGIRAVGHEGRVGPVTYWLLEASAPGLYEISFEGIGADRFHPIPSRRVDVRSGETAEVIVELRRK